MSRPAGQPGTVHLRRKGNRASTHGVRYPAVQTDHDVQFWREKDPQGWVRASFSLAETFEPDEEWKASCTHEHGLPWRTCDSEADCLALRREEAAQEAGEP